jgi:hypothetical protein
MVAFIIREVLLIPIPSRREFDKKRYEDTIKGARNLPT